jgi:hypothetical protein
MADTKTLKDLLKEFKDFSDLYKEEKESKEENREDLKKDFLEIKENLGLAVVGLDSMLNIMNKNYIDGMDVIFDAMTSIEGSIKQSFNSLFEQMDKNNKFELNAKKLGKTIDDKHKADTKKGVETSNLYLKGIRDSVLSFPSELASFLGWGQLYNLIFNNPIVKFVKDTSMNLGKLLFGFGKPEKEGDLDDLMRKEENQRSFFKNYLDSFKNSLNKIADKPAEDGEKEEEEEEGGILGKLGGLIGSLFSGIGSVISKIPFIGRPLMALATGVTSALSSSLKWIVSMITAGIGGIWKFISPTLSKFGSKFIQIGSKLVPDFMQSFFSSIGSFFTKVFPQIFSKTGLQAITKLTTRTLAGASGFIMDFIIGFVKGGFIEGLKEMIFGGDGIFGAIMNSLKYAVAGFTMGGAVGAVVGAVIGLVTNLVTQWAKSVFGKELEGKGGMEIVAMISGYLYGWFIDIIDGISSAFTWLKDSLVKAFTVAIDGIVKAGKWLWNGLVGAFNLIIDGFVSAGKWLWDNLGKAFKYIGNLIISSAESVVKFIFHPTKLMDVMKKAYEWIKESGEKLWKMVLDAMFSMIERYMPFALEGLKIYKKRKEEKEKEEKEEKLRIEREKREALAEKRREREEAKKLEAERKRSGLENVKITDKLSGAYGKLNEKIESSSFMDKSMDMINKMLGDAFDFLARGASSGSRYVEKEGDAKKFYEVSKKSLDNTENIIRSLDRNGNYDRDRIKKLESRMDKKQEKVEPAMETPIINNNSNVVNNNTFIGTVNSDQSFDFQEKKYAYGVL